MATSQSTLVDLLRALDPQAPLAERNLWLVRLLAWVRGDAQDPEAAVARLRTLLDAAEVRPDWLAHWRAWWEAFLTSMDATPLLADLGFAPRASLPSEAAHRLRRKLLPVAPDTTNLGELFTLLLPTEFDARWLRALDEPTLRRLRAVLFPPATDAHGPDYALRTLLDATAYAVSQISAVGQSADIRTRMSRDERDQRAFPELPMVFESVRQAVLTSGRQGAPALIAIARLREQLELCRAAASTVYAHLQEHGISVHIEFQLRQLRQRIVRVKALLLCLETDAPAQATAQLLSHLVRVNRDSASLRALLASSTELLASRVTERNAETGEHYIARSPREYAQLLGAAAGGGAVLAFTTWTKLMLGALALSAFWGGFAAGANYALSFVVIMLLHWTVATKQPAMTAPAMAARLKDMSAARPPEGARTEAQEGEGVPGYSPGAVEDFVDEVTCLLRSQFVSIVGNVGLVVPVVLLLAVLLGLAGWDGVMTPAKAEGILAHHHLLGPTALFAAATGVLLFLSSLIAGWVENWFVFQRLDAVIAYHPRATRRLGAERARRWAAYWRDHISGWAANVSLGLMLGLVPPVLGFFGLPFEVRHVTLVAGQLAATAHELGTGVLHRPEWWWAVGGMAACGLLNVAVSFTLAFRLALAAQNVHGVSRRRVYAALGRRLLRQPLAFVLPVAPRHR
ncbi:recombinase [Ottowia sp.]|uniref:recombinase n=1 Tax=Ottowia sp. TaxID=1898956 RepID=UPI0039E7125D